MRVTPHFSSPRITKWRYKHIYPLLSTHIDHIMYIHSYSHRSDITPLLDSVWLLSFRDHLFEVTFSPWRIAVAVLTIQPAASISLFLFSCTSSLQLGSMNFSSEKCAVCNGSKTELWKFWRLSISISHWEQTKELSWRERNFLFEM